MKHPSPPYKKMKASIKEARRIGARVKMDGCTSKLQHLKLQSLVLLTHAVIEEYLEELGDLMASEARRQFVKEGRITKVLVALVSSQVLDDVSARVSRAVGMDNIANLDAFSEFCLTKYKKKISENNGITESDQKKILFPIGVNPEGVDIATMNGLNSFGVLRGGFAHKFRMMQTEVNRHDIEVKINQIIAGLALYDKAACEALSLGMTRK